MELELGQLPEMGYYGHLQSRNWNDRVRNGAIGEAVSIKSISHQFVRLPRAPRGRHHSHAADLPIPRVWFREEP